jgi:regulatory protein
MPDRQPDQKLPRRATPGALEAAAHDYLKRFATTAAHLRRVLIRRVVRSAHFHGTDLDAGGQDVDRIVAKFVRAGLLDDRLYARARTRELRLRGASSRLVRAKLREKGVGDELIEESLATFDVEEAPEAGGERAAAWALARRRRLGPFRPGQDREFRRERDLAALARAGFGYDVAREVIEGKEGDDPNRP